MFTRRQLVEAAYHLRHATHLTWDADEATLRLRQVLSTPAATHVDRAFVSRLLDAADIPVRDVLLGGWRSSAHHVERLGDDAMLPDLCLWSITWWGAFNLITPTWGVRALRVLWAHAGGSVRERLNIVDVWEARRRIRDG